MLRRVPRDRIRLGMYIQAIEGPWLDHPFWRSRFLLSDPADLAALLGSSIPAVTIDDAKGLGLGDAPVAAPQVPPGQPPPAAPRKPARPPPASCTAAEELDRAARIVGRSRKAVARLFEEARLGKAVDVATVLPVVDEISASVARNASTLISITRLKTKDEYTYMHSVAVCALMINLARQLGLGEAATRDAGIAGLLHDLGKTAMPDHILNKPGKLTDTEFEIMRTHPERGHEALALSAGMPDAALDVCLHHHEKIDGSGYPKGLKGEEISLLARMGAVCDVYDAVTSNRPYKDAWGASDSLSAMFGWKGHFDENILAAFIRGIGIYPVGTLVRLASDRLAVVADQNQADLTRPIVRIFHCADKRAGLPFHDLDIARCPDGDRIVSREDPDIWGFAPWNAHWTKILRCQAGRTGAGGAVPGPAGRRMAA